MNRQKVVIIGGGIGGLTTFFALQKKIREQNLPLEVRLLEAGPRLGGTCRTIRKDRFVMELGPDCFISNKPGGLRLVRELGLDEELIGTIPEYRKSFIASGSKLVPVPNDFYLMAPRSLLPFAFSPILSLRGKIRALQDLWVSPSSSHDDESVADFVIRRLGKEVLDKIAQPMVAGIYTADPAVLSLKATFPQFLEWEKSFGSVIQGLRKQKSTDGTSGPRYGLFVSLKSGMETLTEKLVKSLPGDQLSTNIRTQSIARTDSGFQVQTDRETISADHLVLAIPAHQSAVYLKPLLPRAAELLERIPYASTGTVNLIFREEQVLNLPPGVGFVVPAIEHRSIVGCSFSHRKFENRCPKGYALLRVFFGGALNKEIFKEDDSTVVRKVLDDLNDFIHINGEPETVYTHRWNESMPQYTIGHSDRVQKIESEISQLRGLYLVGNAYRGVGIPDTISSAFHTTDEISKRL